MKQTKCILILFCFLSFNFSLEAQVIFSIKQELQALWFNYSETSLEIQKDQKSIEIGLIYDFRSYKHYQSYFETNSIIVPPGFGLSSSSYNQLREERISMKQLGAFVQGKYYFLGKKPNRGLYGGIGVDLKFVSEFNTTEYQRYKPDTHLNFNASLGLRMHIFKDLMLDIGLTNEIYNLYFGNNEDINRTNLRAIVKLGYFFTKKNKKQG